MQTASKSRRIVVGLFTILAVFPLLAGCQPSSSEEDLGTIVYEVPQVPGSEKTFPMPPLDAAAKSEEPGDSAAVAAPQPGDSQ